MKTFIVHVYTHDGQRLAYRATAASEWDAIDEVQTAVGLVKAIVARRQA